MDVIALRYDPMYPSIFGTDITTPHSAGGRYHYLGIPAMYEDSESDGASHVMALADGLSSDLLQERLSWRALHYRSNRVWPTFGGSTSTPAVRWCLYGWVGARDDALTRQVRDLDLQWLTVNAYGYYITNSFPWVIGCFRASGRLLGNRDSFLSPEAVMAVAKECRALLDLKP